MSNKINKAYKTSKNIYDNILTQNSLCGKIYMKLFWSGTSDSKIANKILSYIPDNFSGTLLDVPVGTAVFTHKKWAVLSNAKITCIDYSDDMLLQAKSRLDKYSNISCVQGDVSNLALDNDFCDVVLSMNGFHAFPDKSKAYKEIHRVLKPSGMFIACFYIKGKNKITDWLVDYILSKKGWFTPPFQTLDDVQSTLTNMYNEIEIDVDGSMVYFKCIK